MGDRHTWFTPDTDRCLKCYSISFPGCESPEEQQKSHHYCPDGSCKYAAGTAPVWNEVVALWPFKYLMCYLVVVNVPSVAKSTLLVVISQGSELFMTDEERLALEARRELDRQELMHQKKVALETNKIIKEQQEKEKQ